MRSAYLLSAVLIVAGAPAAARSQSALEATRVALLKARDTQNQILQSLTALSQRRSQAGSAKVVLDGLSAIAQMQAAVVRNTATMMARTFGQSASALSEQDRHALEQLATDAKAARQRLADWLTTFAQSATGDAAPEALRSMESRVSSSTAGNLMEQAVQQMEANHLSTAMTTGQNASDEVARLLLALEAAILDPQDLRDQRIRELQEIVDRQKQVRSQLNSTTLARADWRRLLREQTEITARTRVMGFEETGIVAGALELIHQGHQSMETGQQQVRKEDRQGSTQSIDAAMKALVSAIQAIQAAKSSGDDPNIPAPPSLRRKPGKPGGFAGILGSGEADVEPSAVGQVAADIALVVKIRKLQVQLHLETTGKAPPKPMPANRQQAYAAQLPQLVVRVEDYLPPAAAILKEAQAAMSESADRLKADDKKASAARQEVALDRLAAAAVKMRAFWKELIEALARLSSAVGEAPAMGASAGPQEKAQAARLLVLLREIVRIGGLIKDQEALVAGTEPWVAAPKGSVDRKAVAEGARKQRALSQTCQEIGKQTESYGQEVAGALPEALADAAEWMDGAVAAFDQFNLQRALERQRGALELIENAWAVIARSMASLAEGQISSQTERRQEPGNREGESNVGGTPTDGKGGEAKPWYWNLPPQARDAIAQSLAQPLPPKHEAAIKRYYERLSNRKKGER